jgi:hypothetical protein
LFAAAGGLLAQLGDPSRPLALLALNDLEFDPLTLGQAAEPFRLDGGVMNETVLLSVLGVMKPKPFASLNHLTVPETRAIGADLVVT